MSLSISPNPSRFNKEVSEGVSPREPAVSTVKIPPLNPTDALLTAVIQKITPRSKLESTFELLDSTNPLTLLGIAEKEKDPSTRMLAFAAIMRKKTISIEIREYLLFKPEILSALKDAWIGNKPHNPAQIDHDSYGWLTITKLDPGAH
jgi:hypothetical protein